MQKIIERKIICIFLLHALSLDIKFLYFSLGNVGTLLEEDNFLAKHTNKNTKKSLTKYI